MACFNAWDIGGCGCGSSGVHCGPVNSDRPWNTERMLYFVMTQATRERGGHVQ